MQLRILTYNIHRAIGVDRRFRPERIVNILRHHDADIVLLQEVDEGTPRSRELDLARELAEASGYPFLAVGHNVSLKKGRYGNATLSRFPILRERNIDLSVAESWIRRGCQHTSIQIAEERTLETFNLHLGLSARERLKQVDLLARCHEFNGLGPATPMLVGGDFNSGRSSPAPSASTVPWRGATAAGSSLPPIRRSPPREPSTASITVVPSSSSRSAGAASRCRAWRATTCRSSPSSR